MIIGRVSHLRAEHARPPLAVRGLRGHLIEESWAVCAGRLDHEHRRLMCAQVGVLHDFAADAGPPQESSQADRHGGERSETRPERAMLVAVTMLGQAANACATGASPRRSPPPRTSPRRPTPTAVHSQPRSKCLRTAIYGSRRPGAL